MAADADRNQIQVNAKRLKGYQRLERNTDPTPAEWPPDLVKNNLWAVPYLQPPSPHQPLLTCHMSSGEPVKNFLCLDGIQDRLWLN